VEELLESAFNRVLKGKKIAFTFLVDDVRIQMAEMLQFFHLNVTVLAVSKISL